MRGTGDYEGATARSRTRDRAASGPREGACAATRGARTPKKSHSVLFRSKGDTFAFIDSQRAHFSVASLCRRYAVTTAGFHAWRRRGESAHAEQDRLLTTEIERLFDAHQERYGSSRLYQLLRNAGWLVSRRRVARLMRAAGLRAKAVRGYRMCDSGTVAGGSGNFGGSLCESLGAGLLAAPVPSGWPVALNPGSTTSSSRKNHALPPALEQLPAAVVRRRRAAVHDQCPPAWRRAQTVPSVADPLTRTCRRLPSSPRVIDWT